MPEFSERKIVAYSAEQMFDLVADVGRYPEFLPWCVDARVRQRTEHLLVADMTIGFGPFRETFTSRVELERTRSIKVKYEQGPFKTMLNEWTFAPDPKGTAVGFWINFEFRSRILQAALNVVYGEAVRRMTNAFLKRARDVYGVPGATTAAARPVQA